MSQYPPPPSFRGSFHSNVQMTPPASNAHHVIPQYPYQPFRDPSNQGLSSTQYANPYSYNTTGQNMNGSLSVAGAPHSPYIGFGQATNGSFPHPPYPPIPPPYGIFPQPSSLVHHREPSLGSIQPHNSLPLKPPPVAPMLTDVNSDISRPVAANNSELEDGELSDGEPGRESADISKVYQKSITIDKGHPLEGSRSNGENLEKTDNSLEVDLETDEHHETNVNYSRDGFNLGPSLDTRTTQIQEPLTSANLDHTAPLQSSNHNHKSDRLGNFDGNYRNPQLSHQNIVKNSASASGSMAESHLIHKAAASADSPRNGTLQQDITVLEDQWRDIREQAQGVLRELHPFGVRFIDYVNAGIDPDVLRKLYASVGIAIASPTLANQPSQAIQSSTIGGGDTILERSIPPSVIGNPRQDNDRPNSKDGLENNRQAVETAQIPKTSSTASEPKAVGDQNPSVSKENTSSLESNVVESKPHNLESDTRITDPNPTSKPVQITKAPKQSPTIALGKSIISKPGDKALERKDYIARMLAAKASKPISVVNNTLSPKTSVDLKETASQTPASGENQLADTEEGRRLCIGNLPYAATEGDLRDLFTGFLSESIHIPLNLIEKQAGFGYVELSNAAEAQRAISELSGQRILDRKVSVQLARKPQSTAQGSEIATHVDDQGLAEAASDVTPRIDTQAKANKKAQTELARQKMEALKNRGNNVQPSHGNNLNATPTDQGPQTLAEDAQPRASPKEPSNPVLPLKAPESIRQGLLYKPVSRESAFNIPGLFMDSVASEKSTLVDSSKAQLLIKDPQAKLEITQGTIPRGAELQDPVAKSPINHAQSSTRNFEATSTTSANSETHMQPAMVGGPRKRQKAADFIDSPSFKIKRPLGQNVDTSVIIEVSEDETYGDTENENTDVEDDIAMDIEEGNGQNTPPKKLSSIESGSVKQKAIRDLPPLSDFPSRKKTTPNVAVIPPPTIHTPSRGKEPHILKTKEKEIELMNRRIAELEQRIKAKQSASRAQTPGTPGSSTASPKLLGISVVSLEKSRSGVSDAKSIHNSNKQTQLQDSTDVAMTANVSEAAEITQTIEAAESVEAARIAIEAVNAAEAIQAARVAEAAKAAKAAELAEAANAIEEERLLAEQRAKAIELAEAERLQAVAAAEAKAEEQRQARRAEIESGLPVLDAEMERTKLRLQSLRKQIEDLESEVQKGVEGRRVLMEELMALSVSPSLSTFNQKTVYVPGSANHIPEQIEEKGDSPLPIQRIDFAEAQQNANFGFNSVDIAQDSTLRPLSQAPSLENTKDRLAINTYEGNIIDTTHGIKENRDVMDTSPDINEHQEDVMDTSPDGPDDCENTDYSPEPPANNSVTSGLVDIEDTYEPPATLEAMSVPTDLPPAEDLGREDAVLQTAPNAPLSNTDNSKGSQMPEAISNSSNDVHVHDAPRASIRSSQFADSSDSDDYEPPEPAPPVENALLSPVNTTTDIVSSYPGFVVDTSATSQPVLADSISIVKASADADVAESIDVSKDSGHELTTNSKPAQFTPYESPLKQFKSYRYYPGYLSEVTRGFRSLTYSHGIDPEKPVCRFESAGGVCNDDSCDGQHFRNMSLSDDMVLVQMGAIPEGLTSEEGDEYANGLRRIIQEIRGRKVRDFNVVASEITAYRAQFLADKLKLLPL